MYGSAKFKAFVNFSVGLKPDAGNALALAGPYIDVHQYWFVCLFVTIGLKTNGIREF
jgi:hypothetical protein